MTLLRFMSRIWYYRIFGPATFLFAVAVPWALLKYGTPSEAKWRKANHQCPAYVPRDLERLFIAQREDPWWEE